jgi:hypothetical protein
MSSRTRSPRAQRLSSANSLTTDHFLRPSQTYPAPTSIFSARVSLQLPLDIASPRTISWSLPECPPAVLQPVSPQRPKKGAIQRFAGRETSQRAPRTNTTLASAGASVPSSLQRFSSFAPSFARAPSALSLSRFRRQPLLFRTTRSGTRNGGHKKRRQGRGNSSGCQGKKRHGGTPGILDLPLELSLARGCGGMRAVLPAPGPNKPRGQTVSRCSSFCDDDR